MVASDLVVILGLGFTGTVLARRLLARGIPVCAAVRDAGRFQNLVAAGLRLTELSLGELAVELAVELASGAESAWDFPVNSSVFYSIPPLGTVENTGLFNLLMRLQPKRIVYISSTGVYGDRPEVDETTPAQPNDDRGRARVAAEARIAAGPWDTLILRAAAIYGPGRGVHAAVREGRLPRSASSGVVSRIHVEDLAALAEAGLFADLRGAWPVADDVPCSSAEIAAWCRKYFGMDEAGETLEVARITGRKVNGRKIRELLGVELKYPSWDAGLIASIQEERRGT
jgi:nucleoside-diphosphate-sugar epimerase